MRRRWVAAVILLVTVGIAVAVAAASRSGEKARRPPSISPASQSFGDDADLMRRLERNKLGGPSR